MSIPGGWLLAPLALAVLFVGTGLLVERACGRRLPGALLPAVGLAASIVVAGPFTLLDATAELAAPAVALVALGGLVVGAPWRDPRLRAAWPWPLLVAAGAYALFAAPSLLTGQGSIAGYVKLDDSATWLALTDQVFSQGRNLSDIPASTYKRTLDTWLGEGYPVGAMLPLGLGAKLTGQDPAGSYQSTIALYAAVLALGSYACARSLVRSRGLAAAAALVGVQASLFLGYAQWGGIKEAATVALLPPLAYAAVAAARPGGVRHLVPLAVVAGALIAVLGLNGLVWGGPAIAVATVGLALAWRRDSKATGSRPGMSRTLVLPGFGLLLAAASLPALAEADFLSHTVDGAISAQDDLGNLTEPLSLLQGAGLWPTGDFRVDPDPRWLAVVLAVTCLLGAVACLLLSLRKRSWSLVALMSITVVGAIPAVVIGAPWIDAKVLATVAPVLLLGAAALVAIGLGHGRPAIRLAAAAGGAVLVAGCGWSTASVVGEVQVAPRERLDELRAIADRIEGQGPTVVLDYETYAQRYFLRDAAPEGATDLRVRRVARIDGQEFPRLSTAEVDEIATPDLWAYRTIVRRRSPVASRPPSAFRLRWEGEAFEVWQRPRDAGPPLGRIPLGDAGDPTGVPSCGRIRTLARTSGGRVLAAVVRQPPVGADLNAVRAPADWRGADVLYPADKGTAEIPIEVPEAGEWRLWVGGTVRGRLRARLAGRDVGSVRHELSHSGQWLRFGAVSLPRGPTEIQLSYGGAAGRPSALGPVVLSPGAADAELPVLKVAPRDAARLCDGRRYDWIEALR